MVAPNQSLGVRIRLHGFFQKVKEKYKISTNLNFTYIKGSLIFFLILLLCLITK